MVGREKNLDVSILQKLRYCKNRIYLHGMILIVDCQKSVKTYGYRAWCKLGKEKEQCKYSIIAMRQFGNVAVRNKNWNALFPIHENSNGLNWIFADLHTCKQAKQVTQNKLQIEDLAFNSKSAKKTGKTKCEPGTANLQLSPLSIVLIHCFKW